MKEIQNDYNAPFKYIYNGKSKIATGFHSIFGIHSPSASLHRIIREIPGRSNEGLESVPHSLSSTTLTPSVRGSIPTGESQLEDKGGENPRTTAPNLPETLTKCSKTTEARETCKAPL